MSELLREFERFESSKENPVEGEEDEFTAFLRKLDAEGKLRTFSEEDWYTLGSAHGLDDEEISELVEQAAGWLGKEKGILESEPADWPEEDPPASANPKSGVRAGGALPGEVVGEDDEEENPDAGGCEGCAVDCDCGDDCECSVCGTCQLEACQCCCECDD